MKQRNDLYIVCKCGYKTQSAEKALKHFEKKHQLERDRINVEIPLKHYIEG